MYAVGAALVAWVSCAWGIGEKTYDYYRPSAKALKAAAARDFTALNREKRIADQKNTAIAFGTFGASLAGLIVQVAAGGAFARTEIDPGRRRWPLWRASCLGGIGGGVLVSYDHARPGLCSILQR